MAILNSTQINGNLNVTEDIQLGSKSITEELNALKTNTVMSSSEVKTRDTFFGKPIYTKTITFTTTISSGVANSVPHGISNIDKIWIDTSNSFLQNSNNGIVYPVSISYYPSGFDNACPYVDKTNINYAVQTSWGTHWTKNITVRYTKTTD